MLHVVAVFSVREGKGVAAEKRQDRSVIAKVNITHQHWLHEMASACIITSYIQKSQISNKSHRCQNLKIQAFFCISYVTGIVIWPVKPPNYVPLTAHYKSCGKMVTIRHNGRAMGEYTVWKTDTVSATVISQFNLYTEVCVLKVSSCFMLSGTHNELLFEAGWQGGDEHEQRS